MSNGLYKAYRGCRQAELDLRIASFAVAATAVYRLTPTAVVHQAYSEIAKVADPGHAEPRSGSSFRVQGK